MGKFYGTIGFSKTEETAPGVWGEKITEKKYYIELLRNIRKFQSSESINDNISISNQMSIIADPFAIENFSFMKYVIFRGAKWKVDNVEVQYPRLILTVGGVYNGDET